MKKGGWGGTIAAVAVVICGCAGNGENPEGPSAAYVQSVGNMRVLANAMLAYTSDHDDIYPPTDRWMDALTPYVPNASAFVSPAAGNGVDRFGYAFNQALAGTSFSELQDPYNVIMIFDSTSVARNSTATVGTLPSPPRYGVSNTIAYANGRVQDGHLADGEDAPSLGDVAVDRMRRLATGLALYANDHDDRLPLAESWTDATMPYVRVDQYYRSPALASDPLAYGFAFHSAIAGRSILEFEAPATTLSFFDSINVQRNATALPSTLPNPPRYVGGNVQAFLDGHVVLSSDHP